MDWFESPQECKQGIGVVAADMLEIDIRKCRIKMLAPGRNALVQGAIEIVRCPRPDTGFAVRCDVGRIDSAECGMERQSTTERRFVRRRVAARAITQNCQIPALGDLILRHCRDRPNNAPGDPKEEP